MPAPRTNRSNHGGNRGNSQQRGGRQFSRNDYLDDDALTYDYLLSLDSGGDARGGRGVNGKKKATDAEIKKAIISVRYKPRKAKKQQQQQQQQQPSDTEEACDEVCEEEDACVICLENFEPGERLQKLRRCECTKSLLYHKACLEQWLKADPSCPQCRAKAVS